MADSGNRDTAQRRGGLLKPVLVWAFVALWVLAPLMNMVPKTPFYSDLVVAAPMLDANAAYWVIAHFVSLVLVRLLVSPWRDGGRPLLTWGKKLLLPLAVTLVGRHYMDSGLGVLSLFLGAFIVVDTLNLVQDQRQAPDTNQAGVPPGTA